jgi:hypothetical protein
MDEQFDLEFSKIQGLTWFPYVGKNFENNDKKILILGESHYGNDTDKYFTRNITNETGAGNSDYSLNFFSKINNFFKITTNKENFWSNLSFYNFIQRKMTNNVERPSKNDFLSGWNVLLKVLEVIKPDYCLFFGLSAADYFNDYCNKNNLKFSKIVWADRISNSYYKTGSLFLNDIEIKLVFVKHPSKFFKVEEWQKALEKNNFELYKHLNGIIKI